MQKNIDDNKMQSEFLTSHINFMFKEYCERNNINISFGASSTILSFLEDLRQILYKSNNIVILCPDVKPADENGLDLFIETLTDEDLLNIYWADQWSHIGFVKAQVIRKVNEKVNNDKENLKEEIKKILSRDVKLANLLKVLNNVELTDNINIGELSSQYLMKRNK